MIGPKLRRNLAPPALRIRPAIEPDELNTAAHRREARMSAVLVVLLCAGLFALVQAAVWVIR